jgi:hypothetical protein
MKLEHLKYYKHLLQQDDTLKVIDTSFIVGYLGMIRTLPIRDAIKLDSTLYDCWRDMANERVTFPSEVVREIGYCGGFYRRLCKNFPRFRNEIEKLVEKKESLINEVFRKYPTENFVRDDRELGKIVAAANRVAMYKGVKVNHSERYGAKPSRKGNWMNDQRIFAKAYSISDSQPVLILTRDFDFIRMQEIFYDREEKLCELHGFPMSREHVDVAYIDDSRGILIQSPDGMEEIINFKKDVRKKGKDRFVDSAIFKMLNGKKD